MFNHKFLINPVITLFFLQQQLSTKLSKYQRVKVCHVGAGTRRQPLQNNHIQSTLNSKQPFPPIATIGCLETVNTLDHYQRVGL